ncbi:MAG: ABC transporter permease [Alphaproteobacteria bacterium]|nr:ABC transporter permease [Alphaproteobacteria bacterium]
MLWQTILLALREIRANTMRSILTALGIIIGVGAVILMVTLGGGVTVEIARQFDSIGGNLLFVNPGGQFTRRASDSRNFKMRDVEVLRRQLPGLFGITASVGNQAEVVFGSKNKRTVVIGTDNEYFRVRLWKFAEGRTFTDGEVLSGKPVCIIGEEVRQDFFGAQSPLGVKIRVADISCEIIGLLSPKGKDIFGNTEDDRVIMPLRTVQRRIIGNDGINTIQISIASKADIEPTKKRTAEILRELRNVPEGQPDNFEIDDIQSFSAQIQSVLTVMTLFVGAIAAVSLVVGGIGIMNIMLVSVTERTREIGIRLAIGARESDVLMQFLIEAMMLSGLGGFLGIAFGLGGSALLTPLLNIPFVFNAEIVVIAFVFSAFIGVVFGYFPARRAARLDPIEALRYE